MIDEWMEEIVVVMAYIFYFPSAIQPCSEPKVLQAPCTNKY